MKDDRDTSELQSRNAHPGLQATLLWEVLCLYMWWQQELCVSVKLNKQVNKIPWLSVTQECVEVDRCELMCCIGCYLCGGRLRPAGWNSEVPPNKGSLRITSTCWNNLWMDAGPLLPALGLILQPNWVGPEVAMSSWGRMSRRRGCLWLRALSRHLRS